MSGLSLVAVLASVAWGGISSTDDGLCSALRRIIAAREAAPMWSGAVTPPGFGDCSTADSFIDDVYGCRLQNVTPQNADAEYARLTADLNTCLGSSPRVSRRDASVLSEWEVGDDVDVSLNRFDLGGGTILIKLSVVYLA